MRDYEVDGPILEIVWINFTEDVNLLVRLELGYRWLPCLIFSTLANDQLTNFMRCYFTDHYRNWPYLVRRGILRYDVNFENLYIDTATIKLHQLRLTYMDNLFSIYRNSKRQRK